MTLISLHVPHVYSTYPPLNIPSLHTSSRRRTDGSSLQSPHFLPGRRHWFRDGGTCNSVRGGGVHGKDWRALQVQNTLTFRGSRKKHPRVVDDLPQSSEDASLRRKLTLDKTRWRKAQNQVFGIITQSKQHCSPSGSCSPNTGATVKKPLGWVKSI